MFAEFLLENWPLVLALVVIIGMLVFETMSPSAGGGRAVAVADVAQITNYQQGVILDIRDKDSFAKGHIANAKNIPFDTLESKINQVQKWQKRPIIVTCNNGLTAKKSIKTLKANGFENLYVLSGGMQAWLKEGFPLVKK